MLDVKLFTQICDKLSDTKSSSSAMRQRSEEISTHTLPCWISPLTSAPNPGKANTRNTPQIPPFPFSSNTFRTEAGSSKSACASSTRGAASARRFALLEFRFRVSPRMLKSEAAGVERTARMNPRPCWPVAPVTRRVRVRTGLTGERGAVGWAD